MMAWRALFASVLPVISEAILSSGIERRIWTRSRDFDQEFLDEKVLKYLSLEHFLDFAGAMTAAEVQALADDPATGKVNVIKWHLDGE